MTTGEHVSSGSVLLAEGDAVTWWGDAAAAAASPPQDELFSLILHLQFTKTPTLAASSSTPIAAVAFNPASVTFTRSLTHAGDSGFLHQSATFELTEALDLHVGHRLGLRLPTPRTVSGTGTCRSPMTARRRRPS